MVRVKKSNRGKIIKNYAEFIEFDWETMDHSVFADVPNSLSHPKGGGIYVLYDNHGLYYVGLTNFSLRSRLNKHTRDRHKKKWNRFSWYNIPNMKFTKDIETALLRITYPRGNKVKGKIGRKVSNRKTKRKSKRYG